MSDGDDPDQPVPRRRTDHDRGALSARFTRWWLPLTLITLVAATTLLVALMLTAG